MGGLSDSDSSDYGVKPGLNLIPVFSMLKNGSTVNLAGASGSVGTPVDFSFGPSSSETWFIEDISAILSDSGTPSPEKFGNITALTNGIQLIFKIDGTENIIATFVNNYEMTMFFNKNKLSTGAIGWLNDADAFCGSREFLKGSPTLKASSSDKVIIRVRDSLANIDHLYFSIFGIRIL